MRWPVNRCGCHPSRTRSSCSVVRVVVTRQRAAGIMVATGLVAVAILTVGMHRHGQRRVAADADTIGSECDRNAQGCGTSPPSDPDDAEANERVQQGGPPVMTTPAGSGAVEQTTP